MISHILAHCGLGDKFTQPMRFYSFLSEHGSFKTPPVISLIWEVRDVPNVRWKDRETESRRLFALLLLCISEQRLEECSYSALGHL